MSDVIGLGSAFVDYFFEVDDQFLKKHHLEAEDDRLFAKTGLTLSELCKEVALLEKSPGGITVNILAVLAHLGVKSTYLGVAGEDSEGDYFTKNLQGVNLNHLISRGKMSICACILSNHGHSRAFLSQLNKSDNDILAQLDPSKLNRSKFVILSNYMYKAGPTLEELDRVLAKLKKGKLILAMSTFYAYFGLGKMLPLLNKTYCLFINQAEVKMLTNMTAREGSRQLIKLGPEIVVCTLGKEGALITTKSQQFFTSPKKAGKLVDSTGAGDTFAAGFIYGLIKNKSPRWSASFASKLSTRALTSFGLHWMKAPN